MKEPVEKLKGKITKKENMTRIIYSYNSGLLSLTQSVMQSIPVKITEYIAEANGKKFKFDAQPTTANVGDEVTIEHSVEGLIFKEDVYHAKIGDTYHYANEIEIKERK